MLRRLYSVIDELVIKYGLYKMETIGDAYMAVGGLPEPANDHALQITLFAQEVCNRYNRCDCYNRRGRRWLRRMR